MPVFVIGIHGLAGGVGHLAAVEGQVVAVLVEDGLHKVAPVSRVGGVHRDLPGVPGVVHGLDPGHRLIGAVGEEGEPLEVGKGPLGQQVGHVLPQDHQLLLRPARELSRRGRVGDEGAVGADGVGDEGSLLRVGVAEAGLVPTQVFYGVLVIEGGELREQRLLPGPPGPLPGGKPGLTQGADLEPQVQGGLPLLLGDVSGEQAQLGVQLGLDLRGDLRRRGGGGGGGLGGGAAAGEHAQKRQSRPQSDQGLIPHCPPLSWCR